MIEESACDCPYGLGLPHTHFLDFGPWVDLYDIVSTDVPGRAGPLISMRLSDQRRHASDGEPGAMWAGVPVPDQIRVRVDWKTVARQLVEHDS